MCDSEGHVIHSDVPNANPHNARFLSPLQKQPRRSVVVCELKGLLTHGQFQIRMPGQTGSYVKR
jgi:hypothetical protein